MKGCHARWKKGVWEERDFKSLLHRGTSVLEVAEWLDEMEAPDLEAFALVEAV
jgi:hypothetical protein